MNEAVILALIGIITTGGGFVGRWIIQRIDTLQQEIGTLQTERATMIAELATLRATVETYEQTRRERDDLRSRLQHRESILDTVAPAWRVKYAEPAADAAGSRLEIVTA